MTMQMVTPAVSYRMLGSTRSTPINTRGHYDPTGNAIASQLRHIFDDSGSIFPESTYSTEIRKQRRWQSVVHSDFTPILNWRDVHFRAKKPQTSLPFKEASDEPTKMFMKWKVPTRLTEEYEDQDNFLASQRENNADILPLQEHQESKIPTPGGSLFNFKPASPLKTAGSGRPPSHITPVASAGRQSAAEAKGATPASARDPMASPSRSTAPSTARSVASVRQNKSKALREKELFQSYEKHDIPTVQEHWFKGGVATRTSLPTPTRRVGAAPTPVRRWIENASDKDRQVAMDFLSSMSQHRNPTEMSEIVELLKNGNESDTRRLRHLRLLTPQTKDQAWMHQTWHHLPTHRNPDVTNKKAIYVETQGTVPRHFTIHPEWGP